MRQNLFDPVFTSKTKRNHCMKPSRLCSVVLMIVMPALMTSCGNKTDKSSDKQAGDDSETKSQNRGHASTPGDGGSGGGMGPKEAKKSLVGKWDVNFMFDERDSTNKRLLADLKKRMSTTKTTLEFNADGSSVMNTERDGKNMPTESYTWKIKREDGFTATVSLTATDGEKKGETRSIEVALDSRRRVRIVEDPKFNHGNGVIMREWILRRQK